MPYLIKMSRAKRWVFTLNNPTAVEVEALKAAAQDVEYLVFGRETGDSGTPHLQGFVIFNSAVRLSTAKNRLGNQRFHLEVSKGTPIQASDYCKKDGDYEEFGDCPTISQGKRTELESFYEWADRFCGENGRPPSHREACTEFPVIMCKFPRALSIAVERFVPKRLVDQSPRPWQQGLIDGLDDDADDRQIKFVVDPAGGKGKSWLVRFLIDRDDVQFLSVGKRDDLAHAIEIQTRIFLLDIPRGQMEYLQYSVLEMLKNCLVFSPKYQSSMKRLLKCPHVIVFCNEYPDMDAMTRDRYYIIDTF